jgi:hypothetical protein
MGAALGIYAPVILRLAADLMEQQGLANEADEIRAICARSEKVFDAILAKELARQQALSK